MEHYAPRDRACDETENALANRGYLINSSALTSDPAELERLREQPGHVDGVVAESSARLLIPWFLCFRQSDLRPVRWESTEVQLPCTTVEQATRRLEESLPLFTAIAGSAALARPYWTLACAVVRNLPLRYVALSPIEILDLGAVTPDTLAASMSGAMSGDLTAVPHLKTLCEYDDKAVAYPLEILYSIPEGVDRHSPRTWNCTLLDFGAVTPEYVHWNKTDDTSTPETRPVPEAAYGELYDVPELLKAWVAAENPDAAGAGLGLIPGATESVVVKIYARSDNDAQRLEAAANLRSRLDTLRHERLEPWCKKNGFGWSGVQFSSPAWARRK
jgi:hypothetical protein